MRRTTALLLGAMLTTVALAGMAGAKHGTTDSGSYTAPAPVLSWPNFPPGVEDPSVNLGGFGFLSGDAEQVQVSIADATGVTTSGLVQVVDADTGEIFVSDAFCGTSEELSIPAEATGVAVYVGPVNGVAGAPVLANEAPPVCPGPGTTGTITASWG